MDIEPLLSSLSEGNPCGDDLSFSPEFDAIAELRREDDATLDQGAWVTELKTADWPAVEAHCHDLLATRSKDLRLAMWFAEAAAFNRGYDGLNQGLALCARMCERHWDGMYPRPEEGDMEERVGNIAWLLNRVVRLAASIAISPGKAGSFSLNDAAAARALQATDSRSPAKEDNADIADRFHRALKATPHAVLIESLDGLEGCRGSLDALQSVTDARLGAMGPSFVPAREALAGAHHELQRIARDIGALAPVQSPEEVMAGVSNGSTDASALSATVSAGGLLESRQQALLQLRSVAAFFRATEPHSPVAYLADKAVRWAEMPLHEWLRTVIKDAGPLAHLEELLGVSPAGSSGPAQ